MDIKCVSSDLSVMGQVVSSDLEQIAAQGFKTLICNRPDNEVADQPLADDIALSSKQQGLMFAYLPVKQVSEQQAQDFMHLLQTLPKPILAYCRSGHRCTTLWAKGMRSSLGNDAVLAKAKQLGYDLSRDLAS